MIKMTFSLDEETVRHLEITAERLNRPKSQVVREAVHEYAARSDKLTERERQRLLGALAEALERIPERPSAEVDAELAALRTARREGGRGRVGRESGTS